MLVKIPDESVLVDEYNIAQSIYRKDMLKTTVDIVSKRRSIYILGESDTGYFRSNPDISRIANLLVVNRSVLNGHHGWGIGGDYRPNFIFLKSSYIMTATLNAQDYNTEGDISINEHTLELTEMGVTSGYSAAMGVWTDNGLEDASRSNICIDLGKSIVEYKRLKEFYRHHNQPNILLPSIGHPNRISFDISKAYPIDGFEEEPITVLNPIFHSPRHAEDNGLSPINVDGLCSGEVMVDRDTHIRKVNVNKGLGKKAYDKNGRHISTEVLGSYDSIRRPMISGMLQSYYITIDEVALYAFTEFISMLLQGLVYVYDYSINGKVNGSVELIRPAFDVKYFPERYLKDKIKESTKIVNAQFKKLSDELGPIRVMYSIEEYQIHLTVIFHNHRELSKIEYIASTDELISAVHCDSETEYNHPFMNF